MADQAADHRHVLRFTVEARHWDTVEHIAANRIRTYTRELKTGPYKVSDEQVLRDATFTAVPLPGNTALWRVDVEVAV